VTEAADRLRERIEQMERDVTQVGIDLRTNVERLHDDLVALQEGTGELAGVAPAAEEEPAPAPEPLAAAPEPEPEPAAAAEPARAAPNGDAAAARIVALDMALSGTPRAETERYLAEHYDVPDRDALLDEVYAAAGG
jgi:hypothetical protein